MIGIFDSGIGGLTVVKELLKQAPTASFVYLGDTARTPYGNKSAETVTRYALEDTRFLLEKGATSIVIACNTASAMATDTLRKEFPSVPIFSVIDPVIEKVVGLKPRTVGVIGTRSTIGTGVYETRLAERMKHVEVVARACPLFTMLVEEGMLDEQVTKLMAKKYLSGFRANAVDVLILGCTHYPLLRTVIRHAVSKRTVLIDPAELVVKQVLAELPLVEGGQTYYLTDVAPHTVGIAQRWLKQGIMFHTAELK